MGSRVSTFAETWRRSRGRRRQRLRIIRESQPQGWIRQPSVGLSTVHIVYDSGKTSPGALLSCGPRPCLIVVRPAGSIGLKRGRTVGLETIAYCGVQVILDPHFGGCGGRGSPGSMVSRHPHFHRSVNSLSLSERLSLPMAVFLHRDV